MNDSGIDKCADKILNCDIYNDNFSKCHTCKDGFNGRGGIENNYNGCCSGDKVLKSNGSKIICVTEINSCDTYAEDGNTCTACSSDTTANVAND